jgi:hypothetical protein
VNACLREFPTYSTTDLQGAGAAASQADVHISQNNLNIRANATVALSDAGSESDERDEWDSDANHTESEGGLSGEEIGDDERASGVGQLALAMDAGMHLDVASVESCALQVDRAGHDTERPFGGSPGIQQPDSVEEANGLQANQSMTGTVVICRYPCSSTAHVVSALKWLKAGLVG